MIQIPLPKKNPEFPNAIFTHNLEIDADKLAKKLNLSFIKDWSHLVVAGGYPFRNLFGQSYDPVLGSDIDFFFVFSPGTSPENARKEMVKTIDQIFTTFKNDPVGYQIYIQRSLMGNIDFKIKHNKAIIQKLQFVVTTWYETVDSVLDSFDLSCCKFAWDGTKLHYTKDAEKALTHQTFSALEESDCSYLQHRINKYKDRKFKFEWTSLVQLEEAKRPYALLRQSFFSSHYLTNLPNNAVDRVRGPKLPRALSILEALQSIYATPSFDSFVTLDLTRATEWATELGIGNWDELVALSEAGAIEHVRKLMMAELGKKRRALSVEDKRTTNDENNKLAATSSVVESLERLKQIEKLSRQLCEEKETLEKVLDEHAKEASSNKKRARELSNESEDEEPQSKTSKLE